MDPELSTTPIATGTSCRQKEVMVWGIPSFEDRESRSIEVHHERSSSVHDRRVQHDFIHLLLEYKGALLIAGLFIRDRQRIVSCCGAGWGED